MSTNNAERQYPLVAQADLSIANIGTGNEVTFDLPPGAMVINVYGDTITAFNGTTNTLTVKDDTTTFISAQDVTSTGRETTAVPAKLYPSGGTITVSMAQTGTATAGRAIVTVVYTVLGRAHEVQG